MVTYHRLKRNCLILNGDFMLNMAGPEYIREPSISRVYVNEYKCTSITDHGSSGEFFGIHMRDVPENRLADKSAAGAVRRRF